MDITVSVLEACPYHPRCLSLQLIKETFFIIIATMSKGLWANASCLFHLFKMDNRYCE